MRVLVLGASGFMGSAIVAALRQAGFGTRCIVRHPDKFRRRFPAAEARPLNLASVEARTVEHWAGLLDGIDAVVNAAGVLQPVRAAEAWAVHYHAPDALFGACEAAGVRRIVHVSAIGIMEADTVYARSKRAGEDALVSRNLDWTVLRPALVAGDGSYGGTSLLRALAAFPLVTPVVGDGTTPVDIIHKDDLATGIVGLLNREAGIRAILEPAGADRMKLVEVVAAYRRWLGLPPRPLLRMPGWLATGMARLGDFTRMHPVTSTALAQLRARLTGDAETFATATGVKPRGLEDWLAARPSESQDLWHARLYLLRPLVRFALAFLWAVSGIVGLGAALSADPTLYAELLEPWAGSPAAATAWVVAASFADLAIALALVRGWQLRRMAWVQIAVVLGYTIGLSWLAPALWGDLYGGLLKNLPILALVLVHRVLEEER